MAFCREALRGGASREPAADRPAEIRHAVKHACTKSHALRTGTAILRGAPQPRPCVFRVNARVKVGRGAVSAAPLAGAQGVCNHGNWASPPQIAPTGGFLSEQRTYGVPGAQLRDGMGRTRTSQTELPAQPGGSSSQQAMAQTTPADAEKNRCEHRAEKREGGSLFRVTEAPFPECHASAGGSVTGLCTCGRLVRQKCWYHLPR